MLKIFNEKGELVRILDHGICQPGYGTFYWDGKNNSGQKAASGLYFYTLIVDNRKISKKNYSLL